MQIKERYAWAGEMAQRISALAALPEALTSIPSTHMVFLCLIFIDCHTKYFLIPRSLI